MAFSMSIGAKNIIIDSLVTQLAGTTGTAGTGSAKFYTGTQPTNADAGTTGTLLCTISGIGWAASTAGTSNFAATAGYLGTAVATGTAGWARIVNGTSGIDGDVGTAATSIFTVNSAAFTSAGVVTLISMPITIA